MLHVTRPSEAIAVGPTDRQSAAIDKARAVSRRQQALLAAAGEAAPETAWIVARVAGGKEKAVDNVLREADVEAWIPVTTLKPERRSHRKECLREPVVKPVWPGYLFVHTAMTPRAWAGLLTVDGMVALLGVEGRPIPVKAEKIALLRRYLASDPELADKVSGRLKKGARVIVRDGPFTSFDGVMLADEKGGRLSIELAIFGRATVVDLELDQVRRLD